MFSEIKGFNKPFIFCFFAWSTQKAGEMKVNLNKRPKSYSTEGNIGKLETERL